MHALSTHVTEKFCGYCCNCFGFPLITLTTKPSENCYSCYLFAGSRVSRVVCGTGRLLLALHCVLLPSEPHPGDCDARCKSNFAHNVSQAQTFFD